MWPWECRTPRCWKSFGEGTVLFLVRQDVGHWSLYLKEQEDPGWHPCFIYSHAWLWSSALPFLPAVYLSERYISALCLSFLIHTTEIIKVYTCVCVCVCVCVCTCMHAKSLQLYLTLCNPMDHSPPGSSVHGDSPGRNTGVGCLALL